MNTLRCSRAASIRGFTLVEVTLALGIAVFCLMVIFGLLNVGINTSSGSIEQSVATNILTAVAGDLRAAPTPAPNATSATSTVYGLSIPGNGGSPTNSLGIVLDTTGQRATGATPGRYRLDVWMRPGTNRGATQARIMVSWPPRPAGTTGSPANLVESFVALDRN